MSLLRVDGLVKRFGGLLATDHLDLNVHFGEVHAVIGPNGAGKTTLINQLSGLLQPDQGRMWFEEREITREPAYRRAQLGIARSYQIISVFPGMTVLENVVLAVQAVSGGSFGAWTPVLRDRELVGAARRALGQVGLEEAADLPLESLAHGARRQLDLAMALAGEPKLLLLDEPLAGLSPAESVEVTRLLRALKGRYGVLLVEHDMDAVFALADRITVLVYGRGIACGTPAEIRDHPDVRDAYLGTPEELDA